MRHNKPYKLGRRSTENLEGVDPRLADIVHEVLHYTDITVIEGLRTKERQQELFNNGFSKTLKSKHIEGKAIDIQPYPAPHQTMRAGDYYQFGYMAGMFVSIAERKGIPVRCGLLWNNDDVRKNRFIDAYHFEIDE